MKDFFTKRYAEIGYTEEEATQKINAVNDAYEVWNPISRWNPAEAIPDPRGGLMVVIETTS